ncbi:MAG: hypothetical protein Tsb005_15910 [Gammaproteobacteria bacterium]
MKRQLRLLIIFIVWLYCGISLAGSFSKEDIKAVFILNFTRFIVWPENAFATHPQQFWVCLFGNDPLWASLQNVLNAETVQEKAIILRKITQANAAKNCQIVYLAPAQLSATGLLAQLSKTYSILTVSEHSNFLRLGGIINFFPKNNNVGLSLNYQAAQQANLKISSKLLRLTKTQ